METKSTKFMENESIYSEDMDWYMREKITKFSWRFLYAWREVRNGGQIYCITEFPSLISYHKLASLPVSYAWKCETTTSTNLLPKITFLLISHLVYIPRITSLFFLFSHFLPISNIYERKYFHFSFLFCSLNSNQTKCD